MQKDVIKKTKSALKFYSISAVAALLFVVLALIAINSQKSRHTLNIGHSSVSIEIATTPQEKSKGLCCRESLDQNAGMLFVYDQTGDYRFWMKDTLIPLDMFWINSEKNIVHIEPDVQPSSYPESFGSDTGAQYILETNAGWAEAHNVKVGDSVQFDL